MNLSTLDNLGRVRLSRSFWMREFLYSEVANLHGLPNLPDDPDLAIAAGRRLCEDLLQPLNDTFGKVLIRSAYRSSSVNKYCNEQQRAGRKGYTCASNEANFARHIWDRRDVEGRMGATACIVIPWFTEQYPASEWPRLAWWIHDHLPYSSMYFFPRWAAFNLNWREGAERRIDSYADPKGCLTKLGMDNHNGSHAEHYCGFPSLARS